jgi:hypothetical protein
MADKVTLNIEKRVVLKLAKEEPKVKVNVQFPIKIELDLRRGLSGEYFIYDHPLMDIVIMPKKNKIVTFGKRFPKHDPYISQDKYFDYLLRKGTIIPDTVQGGNVLGSLEAVYPINDKVDNIQAILLLTYLFIQEELPIYKTVEHYDEEFEDELTDPSPEDSTELGEVPQDVRKGSIDRAMTPYGLMYRI